MTVYLDESVQNYLDWLKHVKNAPYHTFRSYQVDLIQFLKYFLRSEKNEIPSKEEFTEYVELVKSKYGYSTYRRKVTALRNFLSHLIESGINVPDPLVSISLPMPGVDFNVEVEFEEVLDLIEKMPEDSINEVRDKLIFSLALKCGLTVGQLRALKIKDINLASNQIIISKDQLTFIDLKTSSLIEKYIQRQKQFGPVSLEDFLLSNPSRIPFSTRTINLIVDKTSQKMEFKTRLSPSILRRLFAKNLGKQNINKATAEMILGKNTWLTACIPYQKPNKVVISE